MRQETQRNEDRLKLEKKCQMEETRFGIFHLKQSKKTSGLVRLG
jgi:hypothetical protein